MTDSDSKTDCWKIWGSGEYINCLALLEVWNDLDGGEQSEVVKKLINNNYTDLTFPPSKNPGKNLIFSCFVMF